MTSEESEYPRSGTQKARDQTILSVFHSSDDPYLSTSEVAEQLPIGQRATHNRLEDLEQRDILKKKSVGAGNIWRVRADEQEQTGRNRGWRAAFDMRSQHRVAERHTNFRRVTGGWSLPLTIGIVGFASSALLLLLIIALTVNGIPLLFFDLGLLLAVAVILALVGLISFMIVGIRGALRRLRGSN